MSFHVFGPFYIGLFVPSLLSLRHTVNILYWSPDRYTLCEHFHRVCGLSFHPLIRELHRANIGFQYINFSRMGHRFRAKQTNKKTSLLNPGSQSFSLMLCLYGQILYPQIQPTAYGQYSEKTKHICSEHV